MQVITCKAAIAWVSLYSICITTFSNTLKIGRERAALGRRCRSRPAQSGRSPDSDSSHWNLPYVGIPDFVHCKRVTQHKSNSDEYTRSGKDPEGIFPSILGHEGGGVVRTCNIDRSWNVADSLPCRSNRLARASRASK